MLAVVLPFGGCTDDDDEDELVGNWSKVSDFDGVARCSAVTFTVNGNVYVAAGGMTFFYGRKIIHQPYVPAIPGNNPFPDRRSARKTGMYVMSKIRSGSSPAVSAEEIGAFMPKSRR